MPAEVSIHAGAEKPRDIGDSVLAAPWIPAFAGMTRGSKDSNVTSKGLSALVRPRKSRKSNGGPKNLLVRWVVAQGHTVFVLSWVNPDEHLAKKSFEDYILEGPLAALEQIEKATGERQVNAMGYIVWATPCWPRPWLTVPA